MIKDEQIALAISKIKESLLICDKRGFRFAAIDLNNAIEKLKLLQTDPQRQ